MIMHPAIKLRHIRGFLDIAAAGSLTAAARAEGISQPALSRSLAELEALLGQPLFQRQGRRLVLNPAGVTFRRHAAAGLNAFEAGARALGGAAGGGRIRLGVLPTAATRLIPAVALRFRALRPDLTLSVVTGPQSYLLGLLRAGSVELMVGRMPAPEEMADLSFAHLYEEEVVLCARPGHPLAGLAPAALLARVPVILPPKGAAIRRVVDDYRAVLGLAAIAPAFETVSLALGRGIVRQSDAVWFISRGVIEEELERGDLVALPTGARFLSGAVGLTRRQGVAGTVAGGGQEVAGQDAAGQDAIDLMIDLTLAAARGLRGEDATGKMIEG
jgi:LysR family pca operon transcriptional activator